MKKTVNKSLIDFPLKLLAWFDKEKRLLPWRRDRNPWHILLSEFMLQQTRVEAVIPYFEKFLQKWPDASSFASASEEEVLEAWAGLGYYSRARNLHKASKIIRDVYKGQIPQSAEELKALPGIGRYTAAAVASMAFGEAVPSIDGNLLRILSRLSAAPWQAGNNNDLKECAAFAADLIPSARPGDFNEAMMDLGSAVCLPVNPRCPDCPIRMHCAALQGGNPEDYPRKAEKSSVKAIPVYYLILTQNHKILLRKRSERLLHAFYEFIPLTAPPGEICSLTLNGAVYRLIPRPLATLNHVFSHRVWNIRLYKAELHEDGSLPFAESGSKAAEPERAGDDFSWQSLDDAAEKLLPPFLRPFVRSKETC